MASPEHSQSYSDDDEVDDGQSYDSDERSFYTDEEGSQASRRRRRQQQAKRHPEDDRSDASGSYDSRGSEGSFQDGDRSYYDDDDRSYRSDDDRSYRSGDDRSYRSEDDDRSYRSEDDDRSYRSGDSRYDDGGSRGSQSFRDSERSFHSGDDSQPSPRRASKDDEDYDEDYDDEFDDDSFANDRGDDRSQGSYDSREDDYDDDDGSRRRGGPAKNDSGKKSGGSEKEKGEGMKKGDDSAGSLDINAPSFHDDNEDSFGNEHSYGDDRSDRSDHPREDMKESQHSSYHSRNSGRDSYHSRSSRSGARDRDHDDDRSDRDCPDDQSDAFDDDDDRSYFDGSEDSESQQSFATDEDEFLANARDRKAASPTGSSRRRDDEDGASDRDRDANDNGDGDDRFDSRHSAGSFGEESYGDEDSRSGRDFASPKRADEGFHDGSDRSDSRGSKYSDRDDSYRDDGSFTSNRSLSKQSHASGQKTAEASHEDGVHSSHRSFADASSKGRYEDSYHSEEDNEASRSERNEMPRDNDPFMGSGTSFSNASFGGKKNDSVFQKSPEASNQSSADSDGFGTPSATKAAQIDGDDSSRGDDFDFGAKDGGFGDDAAFPTNASFGDSEHTEDEDGSKGDNGMGKSEGSSSNHDGDASDADHSDDDDAFRSTNDDFAAPVKTHEDSDDDSASAAKPDADAFQFGNDFDDGAFDDDPFGSASENQDQRNGDNDGEDEAKSKSNGNVAKDDGQQNGFGATDFSSAGFGSDAFSDAFDNDPFANADEKKNDTDEMSGRGGNDGDDPFGKQSDDDFFSKSGSQAFGTEGDFFDDKKQNDDPFANDDFAFDDAFAAEPAKTTAPDASDHDKPEEDDQSEQDDQPSPEDVPSNASESHSAGDNSFSQHMDEDSLAEIDKDDASPHRVREEDDDKADHRVDDEASQYSDDYDKKNDENGDDSNKGPEGDHAHDSSPKGKQIEQLTPPTDVDDGGASPVETTEETDVISRGSSRSFDSFDDRQGSRGPLEGDDASFQSSRYSQDDRSGRSQRSHSHSHSHSQSDYSRSQDSRDQSKYDQEGERRHHDDHRNDHDDDGGSAYVDEASYHSSDRSSYQSRSHSGSQSYVNSPSQRSRDASPHQSPSQQPQSRSQSPVSRSSRGSKSTYSQQQNSAAAPPLLPSPRDDSSADDDSSFKLEMEPEEPDEDLETSIRLGEVFGKPNDFFDDQSRDSTEADDAGELEEVEPENQDTEVDGGDEEDEDSPEKKRKPIDDDEVEEEGEFDDETRQSRSSSQYDEVQRPEQRPQTQDSVGSSYQSKGTYLSAEDSRDNLPQGSQTYSDGGHDKNDATSSRYEDSYENSYDDASRYSSKYSTAEYTEQSRETDVETASRKSSRSYRSRGSDSVSRSSSKKSRSKHKGKGKTKRRSKPSPGRGSNERQDASVNASINGSVSAVPSGQDDTSVDDVELASVEEDSREMIEDGDAPLHADYSNGSEYEQSIPQHAEGDGDEYGTEDDDRSASASASASKSRSKSKSKNASRSGRSSDSRATSMYSMESELREASTMDSQGLLAASAEDAHSYVSGGRSTNDATASIAKSSKSSKSKRRKKRRKKRSNKSEALISLSENIHETMLVMEEEAENKSEYSGSKNQNEDNEAHDLLHSFDALLVVLDQLSDELELISTFGKSKKKKNTSALVSVQALEAVISFDHVLDEIYDQLRRIIEDCFIDPPDDEMADMLKRLTALVDLLNETTHRVGEKQEWNTRAETVYVTLIELMERESLELNCYFDEQETPDYELSDSIYEAWQRSENRMELDQLMHAAELIDFRQICYEVLITMDQWCPDTDILMDICAIDPSLLEEDPIDFLPEEELPVIPEAAENILDQINGDPLPRPRVMASILRRILPPRAVVDKTVLDYFTSIRNTLDCPLDLPMTNVVSITSVPESLDQADALGVGGVGKSTLAAMVAAREDVRNYFEDGVLWVYVGDTELNYKRYTQCLTELISQLDSQNYPLVFPELIHTPGEPMTKRRRREAGFMIFARDTVASILKDKCVLVILDNICFEPDLSWFDFTALPDDGVEDFESVCAIVATTRYRDLLGAADTVEIDMFDEADAISLFIEESGDLSHSLLAESKKARQIVQECANHPLTVKSVGRWLHAKHMSAGIVSGIDEIHEMLVKSSDSPSAGDQASTDMLYEVLKLSLSPDVNGNLTIAVKFCLASFVTVFCAKEYVSDYNLVEPTPLIPTRMMELLFETLLELNESSLLKEGSLFSSQKESARAIVPTALCSLGVLQLHNFPWSTDGEVQEIHEFYQITHFIYQEYGEYLCNEDETLTYITKNAEREWNRAFVDAYLAEVEAWNDNIDDPGHSYALEMMVAHMIRGGMHKEAAGLLANKKFVLGRLLSFGRRVTTSRHIKDCELLYKVLVEHPGKGQARLEPRKVMKQAYRTLGGLLAFNDENDTEEELMQRNDDIAWSHYEIGFSLAEKRCWDAAIAHWETSHELFLSTKGPVELVAGIHYSIGVVYAEMNEYEKSLDSLKKCLRIRGTIHEENHSLYALTIQKIGDVFLGMSDYYEAMESYKWALDIMYKEPSLHRDHMGDILDNKGVIHKNKGENEEALKCHEEALRSKQIVFGQEHPELAVTYAHIGRCLSDSGERASAINHYDEAIHLLELDPEGGAERDAEIQAIEGMLYNLEEDEEMSVKCYEKALQILVMKVPYRKEKIASLLHVIGCIYLKRGEARKAMKLFEESLQARRKVLGFVHLDVANTLFVMSYLHQTRNRVDKALKCLEEALKIRQLRLPRSEKVAVTYAKIGTFAKEIGKTRKAERAFKEALKIRTELHGEKHEDVAEINQELGDLMNELGEYESAMENYMKVFQLRTEQLGSDHILVAETLHSMGFTLHHQGKTDRAIGCFKESLVIRAYYHGEDSSEVAETLNMLGFLTAKKGDLNDAMTFLWDALRIRKRHNDEIRVSETLKNIGNTHREKKEFDLALECYEKCLQIRRTELGDDHEKVADALIAMGNIQNVMNQTNEAMRSFQEALKIRTMLFGEYDESVALVLQYMGLIEFAAGNHERARDLLTEFIRIRRDNNNRDDGDYVNVLFTLGNIHRVTGNEEEAIASWTEAREGFKAQGLEESNPKTAKIMNHLLQADMKDEEEDDKKKKKKKKKGSKKSNAKANGMFGKVSTKMKDTSAKDDNKRSGRSSNKNKPKKRKKAKKGKGIQL